MQRVESVLLSIISLLDDAECSSPANVDAGILLRKDRSAFARRVKEDVEKSREDIPKGFAMPTHESTVKRPLPEDGGNDDADFWNESPDEEEEEEDFGGSDTDEEMTQDDYDDDEGDYQEEVEDREDREDEENDEDE